MNIFLLLVSWTVVSVSAKPDVSLGYHYNPDYNSGSNLLAPPIGSTSYYPTASGTVGAVNPEGFDSGAATTSGGSVNFLAPDYDVLGGSSSSASATSLASGFSGISSASASSSSFASSGTGIGLNTGNSGQGYIGGDSGGFGQGYDGGSDQDQQYSGQIQQQAPIITKHFYIHSAPEDHDNQEIVRYVTIGRPIKNYKVVFINAPSSTSTKAKIIANVAPVEDRTAIYVLSKKANDLDISADVVTPPPTGPNKPDVYFVKYKTPQEAIHAQHVIQAQYDKLGGTSDISNEGNVPVQSVIGSASSSANVASVSSALAQSSSQVGGGGYITAGPSLVQQVGGYSPAGPGPIQQIGSTQPQSTYLPPTLYRRRRYYTYRY